MFFNINFTITNFTTIENVLNLKFIFVNGPPVSDFNPRPYIKVWLRVHQSVGSASRSKIH